MASYITVSSRKEFNVRLWSKAAQQRQYSYVQTDGVPRRVVPAEDGEPPGQNDGMKNLHLNWVQHWWEYEERLAAAEGRPPKYTLIHEPPAAESGKEEQAKGAKLLAFYKSTFARLDTQSEPLVGVNTQVEKCMIGFFGDMLFAQFDDCPLRMQKYSMLSTEDNRSIKDLAKLIDRKVRERRGPRDAYSETLGAALTEEDMLKYYDLTTKEAMGYNWGNIMSLNAIRQLNMPGVLPCGVLHCQE
jgi:hypothetical protein